MIIRAITAAKSRRYKLMKLLLLLSMEIRNQQVPRIRSCRRLPRNNGWWETVASEYDDKRFKETFRISRQTFQYILCKIRPFIEKDVVSEMPIQPEMRLAVTLYKLARGDYNYTIAEMAGIGEATVIQIVDEVTQVIVDMMWGEEVGKYFPKTDVEFAASMKDMDQEWQFPYAFAAVDGSHLPIKCPPGGAMKQYHNLLDYITSNGRC